MSEIFSVESSFQYSVNLDYDFGDDEKLKNFIPTSAALNLLEEILLSVNPKSSERARILIGAYGKGKSHIVLMILSLLMKRDLALFEKLLPKLEENPTLNRLVQNYYGGTNKILPVMINGSNVSLSQAFLTALHRTLVKYDLLDVMPQTNYQAALKVLERWKKNFPNTFAAFKKMLDEPFKKFVARLKNFDVGAYETFEKNYPALTSGSVFNPFLDFEPIEIYESVAKSLRTKGFSGLYVVFDEFSKFLETKIVGTSLVDTKMLQDFAERCSRSGNLQLHLMLISHKEIINYIDKLPKDKVDGWRGVSDRFSHVRLRNDFAQIYEVIAAVIRRDKPRWKNFVAKHGREFDSLFEKYLRHRIFSDVTADDIRGIILNCFPLHPVATFILPRLSELVAQNERTLFTFLSAQGTTTLPAFLESFDDDFRLLTPDLIYDYFESLFRKEIFDGEIHEIFLLTSTILNRLEDGTLAAKIIKTISLIYILAQFERLTPTKAQILEIFSCAYETAEIESVLNELIEKDLVVYLKRSNGYLKLRKYSGVDVRQKICNTVQTQKGKIFAKDVLNGENFDNYIYPSRYNDEREMTRYFSFKFIDGAEIFDDVDWDAKSEKIDGDGVIFGVLPKSEDELKNLPELLCVTSKGKSRYIFVLPKKFVESDSLILEFAAVKSLRELAEEDPVLFDEYDVIFEDLQTLTKNFVDTYTRPENLQAIYVHDGQFFQLRRRSELTELMSKICDEVYNLTPKINNETVNKNEITSVAAAARNKIVAALLREELEPNLGLYGTGQEVSIMRSTLIRTGIFIDGGDPRINLRPENSCMRNLLATIGDFILTGGKNFGDLYDRLTSPKYHIGLRRGVIPIYLAAVFNKYRRQIVISNGFEPVPLNVEAIVQINIAPEKFSLEYVERNVATEIYLSKLAAAFDEYFLISQRNSFDDTANAMRRWFLALPKYAKEFSVADETFRPRREFLKALRQNLNGTDLLFKSLPKIFPQKNLSTTADEIVAAKKFFDGLLNELQIFLIAETKKIFSQTEKSTLQKIFLQWASSLNEKVFEQIFSDGTESFLRTIKNPPNDEKILVTEIAELATGLRLEDWNDATTRDFFSTLVSFKSTAENFHVVPVETSEENGGFQIKFFDSEGEKIAGRFDAVEVSPKGKLLFNRIVSALDAMGRAISVQEKRQILADVLKRFC